MFFNKNSKNRETKHLKKTTKSHNDFTCEYVGMEWIDKLFLNWCCWNRSQENIDLANRLYSMYEKWFNFWCLQNRNYAVQLVRFVGYCYWVFGIEIVRVACVSLADEIVIFVCIFWYKQDSPVLSNVDIKIGLYSYMKIKM